MYTIYPATVYKGPVLLMIGNALLEQGNLVPLLTFRMYIYS